MIRIFLAYSSKDKDKFINYVAENLKQNSEHYIIWYYEDFKSLYDSSINYFLEKLDETELFVVFISSHSLTSIHVEKEIDKAIRLHRNNSIKKILPLLIDSTLDPDKDQRILEFFESYDLEYVKTPFNAVSAIEKCCSIL